jgi:membrane dipeptidase
MTTTPSASPAASHDAAPPASVATAPLAAPAPSGPIRVIDMHVDTAWQISKGRSLDLPEGQATMRQLADGRYAAITYAIYISDKLHGGKPTIADADAILGTVEQLIAKHPDRLWDPRAGGVAPPDKVTALISIEGAGAFASDITQIDRFIAKGVRFIGPVHSADNKLASSATGAHPERGLTEQGKAFCRRVYAAGALVDVSHMSDQAFEDLVPIAAEFAAPIVATHSNARAVADAPRNLTDDQLRAIAKSGGVAGLNLHGSFLRVGSAAGIADAVKMTRHMVAVAGAEHVGIGSDFDGASPPADLADASRLPALGDALQKAGLSESEVRAIFEGNVRRVLAWKPKARVDGGR